MRTDAELTYREVGATRTDPLPAGYHHVRRDVVVGHGAAAFERAADGLLHWRMHRLAGLAPVSSAEPAAPGTVVVLRAGLGPVRVTIPCRVVYTVAEAGRRGFAYGTLPGHPERGEEAFLVELAADGAVWVRIRAFSRPASLLARAGGPLTRLAQRWATDRYVAAVRRLARPRGESD
ncbi:uncharacterized protein (UPF0548 family) [Actinoplanes octamycinicus]|uniref:Uncharacterized protein (UPF0548 family) n=1 Tax=Actinoplanes octamycinicus TaxID=135948 RepID=A0A7W7MC63_9ACTN|nr:DUF1990 domain-containing protein [Actinoplanes octamycinicus]MBB4744798.1 uncharacterized protein (UPF0548 family) [Actinoplanes octamycinicus]GIE55381.1 DUF1990 domain-containing protein [Actinoplanes octamycinicus]